MNGQNICFNGEILLIIPKLSVTPSYLEHCFISYAYAIVQLIALKH